MDLTTVKGAKVKFTHPDAGYPHHVTTAKKHLTEGAEYTVKNLTVGGWSTAVELVEVPGVAFNSVQFSNV